MVSKPFRRGFRRLVWVVPLLVVALVLPVSAAGADTTRLARAHPHNDYEHDRPLRDALDHGFTSVEADIWLVGGVRNHENRRSTGDVGEIDVDLRSVITPRP